MIRWLVLALAAGPAMAEVQFIDRSGDLPVQHIYSGGWEHFVGGGVAVLDCNGDALPDLYVAGGTAPARLFVNATASPGAALRFALGDAGGLTDVTGAYPLDVDGDGLLDLVVLRVGGNVMLRGQGDCTFRDATEEWGVDPGAAWTTAFSATWEGDNALPTLAFGNYVDRDDPEGPFGTCDDNRLLRPEGRRYGAPIALSPGYCALSMLISDWAGTGRRDLRVSNDRHYYVREGAEQMIPLDTLQPLTEAEGWPRLMLWGMGIASRDITGDGLADVMLTSMGDQLLQFARPGGRYENAPYGFGSYVQRPFTGDDGRPSTGWHAEFGDVNNDGWDDLFIAKGNVDQMPGNASKDPNNLLIRTPDGPFTDHAAAAGVASPARSRGAALVDLNLDGRLDLVVVNRRAPLEVHENATEAVGNWLALDLRAEGANTRAVGAWIDLRLPGGRIETREITVGGGHAGGQAGPHHFGLGQADGAEVRLRHNGQVTPWRRLDANARVTLRLTGEGDLLIAGR
ncbi:FG-GAP repeat domain-containing protein [Oceaniglobus trochenteri]|uniref:FG-GAP repeat domain-containing protein n=1 Tax=Oceaniglobus trochenteri TaxID=2763260 RepID=UPI001D00154F|nr:VCBS repeat-containing protein [Oceaniglobus trochenteri]